MPAHGELSQRSRTLVHRNTVAMNSSTDHWVGDSLRWSAQCGGCLMWTREGRDWSSQDEGEYRTPAQAEEALAWYGDRGVRVDWSSLDSRDVVNQG